MRFFTCLLDHNGYGISANTRQQYEALPRSRSMSLCWELRGNVAALIASDDGSHGNLLAYHDGYIGLGDVRLDNRQDVERWAACPGAELSDLDLVLRLVVAHGTQHLGGILGDFGFVVAKVTARTVVAACDPFAVKKLYYAEQPPGVLVLASRGEVFAYSSEQYDVQYLSELVAHCYPTHNRCAFAGVTALPAATAAVLDRGKLRAYRYWSPDKFERASFAARSERDAVEQCRDLLERAVRTRLPSTTGAWAQLSGGLDSSSVVSMVQWLYERGVVSNGLAGAVTWVDNHGTGADERHYANTISQRYRIRHEEILDIPVWHSDGDPLPRVDQPGGTFSLYARERRLCSLVRNSGGAVLLTGRGGDELFLGNMFFFADWIAAGRVWPALEEMVRRAAIGRVSFWELAYKNALLPLLPKAAHRHLVREEGQVPPWVVSSVARRYSLFGKAAAPRSYGGRIGRKYSDAMTGCITALQTALVNGVIEETLDVRHPYLYRPLVEFALSLPPELCVRPYARKWILREATSGIVPDVVRKRVGKGLLRGLMAWSLTSQGDQLRPMVENSILAELGIIDTIKFQAAFEAAQYERDRRNNLYTSVQNTLNVEAWLQMRSGRWARYFHGNNLQNLPDSIPVASG